MAPQLTASGHLPSTKPFESLDSWHLQGHPLRQGQFLVSPLLWKGRLGGVVNGGPGQGSAHPCLLAPALPQLGEKPQRPVGESQHVSRPGGEPRQAEWVSRAHSCPRGLCPLQPAGPWPGPIRGGWTAPVPARPCDGVGARAQSRTVLNQDLRPAPVPPSAALGSSEGPRRGDCGGQTGRCPPQPQPDEVASWLRARGQGLRGPRAGAAWPAGRGCVHSFSGPGRNSKCVLPLPPLLLSLVGAGLWASGEDASAGPGLQAGTAAEAMGHAPLSPLDTPTP